MFGIMFHRKLSQTFLHLFKTLHQTENKTHFVDMKRALIKQKLQKFSSLLSHFCVSIEKLPNLFEKNVLVKSAL